jgi:hypothetical protein
VVDVLTGKWPTAKPTTYSVQQTCTYIRDSSLGIKNLLYIVHSLRLAYTYYFKTKTELSRFLKKLTAARLVNIFSPSVQLKGHYCVQRTRQWPLSGASWIQCNKVPSWIENPEYVTIYIRYYHPFHAWLSQVAPCVFSRPSPSEPHCRHVKFEAVFDVSRGTTKFAK